ncbi:MAG: sulfatase-like hydrolase/transferase [Phycisphaerales bacterium]
MCSKEEEEKGTTMQVRRRWAAALVAVVGALTLGAQAILAQSQPNLIFILTDDQGIDAIQGANWSNELDCRTPNLASLAAQGTVFTNTRVNPNCSPTRAALFTGRDALQTGVNGVISQLAPPGDRDLLSLQTHERTIAEVLQDMGYYTILVDKYHLGYDESRGQRPLQQGFMEHYGWLDYLGLDDPEQIGDEHVTRMADFAIDAVNTRPNMNQPYALFFWSIVPHRRDADSQGLLWWQVDPALAPQTSGQGQATNTSRYRNVIEALDTEVGRMLREIGVIDFNNAYQQNSDAVVVFTSDNGTDNLVSAFGSERAKNSPYEGGIHVPCFAFGESVPAGVYDERLISHVDFYETFADLAGAPEALRGDAPRRGISFADALNTGLPGPNEVREYSLLSFGRIQPQHHLVSFTDGRYLLVAAAGGTNFEPLSEDEFYDLENDPDQVFNLVDTGMSLDELNHYFDMRDKIVDYWPSSVSDLYLPENFLVQVTHEVDDYRLIVTVDRGQLLPPANDEFYDLIVDPDALNNLVVSGMTPEQQQQYDTMRSEVVAGLNSGAVGPDTQVIDLPMTHSLVLSSDWYVGAGALSIGHRHPGEANHEELRAYLRFDIAAIDTLLPAGYTVNDIVDAQVIVAFNRDSQAADETDTGVIRVHPVNVRWHNRPRNYPLLENGYSATELGWIDLPPHILPDPIAEMRGIPLPNGTPVSFGHNANLLAQVLTWYNNPSQNNGVALIADPMDELGGDQSVDFLRNAGIRLTLRR